MGTTTTLSPLLGTSSAMEELRDFIVGVSLLPDPILMTGGYGTGKSLAARKIHAVGRTAGAPFHIVSSEGLDREALAWLLLEEGRKSRAFAPRAAPGSTCFFTDVENLAPEAAKEIAGYLRAGAAEGDRWPRLIFSSAFDLDALIHAELIDMEVLEMISTYHMGIPPLQERIEDIPILSHYHLWLNSLPDEYEERWQVFQDEILPCLLHYPWPGNVAELIEVVRSYCGADGDEPRRYAESLASRDDPETFLREHLRQCYREMLALLQLEDLSGRSDLLIDPEGNSARF
ncbi:MAG: sigma 54-interacting transcriptional regulator [Planctomycetota bacterium]